MSRSANKFPCEDCGSPSNTVVDSRWHAASIAINRKRVCLNCGCGFRTVEISIGRFLELQRDAATVASIKTDAIARISAASRIVREELERREG